MVEFIRARDLPRPELRRRLRAGSLVRMGRGVYATAAIASTMGAAGDDAVGPQLGSAGRQPGPIVRRHPGTFGDGPGDSPPDSPPDMPTDMPGDVLTEQRGFGTAGRTPPDRSPSLAAYLEQAAFRWRRDLMLQCVQWGPGVVVARSAAAALWGLDGFEPPVPLLANVARSSGIRHPAVRRVAPLEPVATISGFDVTGVAQTLVELGAGLTSRQGAINDRARLRPDELVELAVESALHLGLVKECELLDVLAGCGNRRAGAGVLQAVLERRPYGAPPTESYLETRGMQVLRNGGVEPGQRQVEIRDRRGRYLKRVDVVLDGWLIVEFDGEAYHDPERDRALRSAFTAAGYLVLPFDFEQVTRFPKVVVQQVTDARCGPTGGGVTLSG